MDAANVGEPRPGNAGLLLFRRSEGSTDETEASRLVSFLWESGHLVRHPPLSASPAINYQPQMLLQSSRMGAGGTKKERKKKKKKPGGSTELNLSALLVLKRR